MKRLLASIPFVLAAAIPAPAADLGMPSQGPSWRDSTGLATTLSGVYVSAGAGLVYADAAASYEYHGISAAADFAVRGFTADLRLGYDFVLGGGSSWKEARGGSIVIGPWVSVSQSSASGSASVGVRYEDYSRSAGIRAEAQTGYAAGLRGGWLASPSTLFYGIVGMRSEHAQVTWAAGRGEGGVSADLTGTMLGAGIETKIAPHVTFALEADYTLYGTWSPVPHANVDMDALRTTGRVAYHF